MLNAGNELLAEQAGCVRLAALTDYVRPYLGTVVAVVGDQHLGTARRLMDALIQTMAEFAAGTLDDEARDAAARRLALDDELARRYLARMHSADEGLVPDGVADRESLKTLVTLRRTYSPQRADGHDMMETALAEDSGLVDRR
jgi:hypothetical protein